jgi:type VI secretion system protein ImpA
LDTVKVASDWLTTYWDTAFPPIDGDGIERRSALNCFADPIAVIDALRKALLVKSRQGNFSLRDIDIASGQMPPGKNEAKPDEGIINGAFGTLPLEELTELQGRVATAIASLKTIDAKTREEVGTEAAPSFELLSTQLGKIDKVLRAQVAARPGATPEGEVVEGQAVAAGFSGAIRSRQEAIRALELVADYFRHNEPSSPVPMFCDRARRLISAGSFLDVLADIAPEAVASARAAGGVRD